MFHFMGSNFSGKGKQRQQDVDGKMEVHVQTEVHSAPAYTGHQDFETLGSTSSLPATLSTPKRPLPPGLRVPTHPYPWHHHNSASSSQSSLESPVTPSHVSWISGGAGGPSVSRTASSSVPNLLPYHFPPPPPTAPPANSSRARQLHPSKSTHSLRVPVQEYFAQPLSPIAEQEYMSPENRPTSLPNSQEGSGSRTSCTTAPMLTPISPSMITPTSAITMNDMHTARTTPTPTTPVTVTQFARRRDDEHAGDSPRPSPIYATFLSRPLNRSISMSSTRTHHSGSSVLATPPVIPPLDLRPQFPGPLPPDSLLTRDIADEGLGTPDDADASTKRESFVTAPSAIAPRESRYSALFLDLEHEPIDEEEFPYNESMTSLREFFEHQRETPQPPPVARAHSPVRPTSRTSTYPPSYTLPHPYTNHDKGVHASSLRSSASVRSTTSSFIDRRFAESKLYLSSRTECSSARQSSEKWTKRTENSDTARTLFWLGFVAPWCWLIGGWLVKAKKSEKNGGSGHTLPLWTGKNAQHVDSFRMRPLQHGYPFVAPSVQDLMPPSFSRAVHPRGPFLVARSPWIRRCRIAACVSGVVIMLLFIAALVVVGRSS